MTIEVYDGLDIEAEFEKLLQLREFNYPLGIRRPKLEIGYYRRQPHRLGTARADGSRIRLNLARNPELNPPERRRDRYDVQEVLVHELTHIYVSQRYGPGEHHGDRFWRHLDVAFQEAYGPLTVAPRRNRYHGRYAETLRRQAELVREVELVDSIDALLVTEPRSPITAEQLPEPLRTYELQGEPTYRGSEGRVMPISTWLDGRDGEAAVPSNDRRYPGLYAHQPITGPRPIDVTDDRVLSLITQWPGISRADVQTRYEALHEQYRGKSVYNSMWRLRRDNRIRREGRRWYPVTTS